MSTPQKVIRLSKIEDLLFLIVLALATFLYLFNISFSDIWVDEVFTKELVQKPLGRIIDLLKDDFHPPVYFFGLKLFSGLFGMSDFSIRFFSAIGALLTIIIAYVAGQRVLGKRGALVFSLLLLSIPMLAYNAQMARMYTWAVFFTTGMFLYTLQFLKAGNTKSLILLGIFSILAIYTHYYCIIAAFWTHLFIFIYLITTKKANWKAHLLMSVVLIVLFLPWLFILLKHIGAANEEFWTPPASLKTFYECYIYPFALQYHIVNTSVVLILVIYILSLISLFVIYKKSNTENDQKITLSLSLVVFHGTVLSALIVSLFMQSILYYRYVMTMISILMVPTALALIRIRKPWMQISLLLLIVGLSLSLSIRATYFSYGPYKQTMEHLNKTHPEIKKIIYQTEVSLAPLLNYSQNDSLQHYWLQNENSIYYTNLDVFDNLKTVNTLDEMLNSDEHFCFAAIMHIPFNYENASLILNQSNILSVDTIVDNKVKNGMHILLHYLEYHNNDAVIVPDQQ